MAALLDADPTPASPTPASPDAVSAVASGTQAVGAQSVKPDQSPVASDWRVSLPDDLKAHKGLEKFKDPASLAKSYLQMEAYQGRSVVMPNETATPEERAAFEAKIDALRGVPDAPEKYPITAPPGMEFDPGLVKEAQAQFHALRLTPAQAAGLMDLYRHVSDASGAIDKLRTDTTQALKAQWGGAFEYNLTRADGTAHDLDRRSGANLLPVLRQHGLHVHPAVIQHYHWLSRQFAEDGDLPTGATGVMGPEEAKAAIAAIRADRTHPYHQGDKTAIAEMQRLYELSSQN